MDHLTKEQRSWNMSRVHGKDTKPEMIVRSFLHRNGFRFRLHVKALPGCPDIVLPKYKTVIEVRGCFWHRHPGCKKATMPATNRAFWHDKLQQNVARDAKNDTALSKLGWRIIVIWGCQLSNDETLRSLPALISHGHNSSVNRQKRSDGEKTK